MKKKVINVIKNVNINENNKIIAVLTALSLSLTNEVIIAKAIDINNENNIVHNELNNKQFNIDYVMNDIYQKQMDYLIPTIEKLKDFYNERDTKDIIKNGYKNAYNVINTDLNYYKAYNGTDYDYISKEYNLFETIKKNNILINNLKIKSSGNGRDTDYGVIYDDSSELGFRLKTNEDIELIDEYTNIVKNNFILDNSLINLLERINNNENVNDLLLNVLEDYYERQMIYIDNTRNDLKEFYDNEDSNLIKESYSDAYNSYSSDLNAFKVNYGSNYSFIDKDIANSEYLSNNELIEQYIYLIKRNNIIINNFKIKRNNSARDTDYNMIIDNNNELGFRTKTDEDKMIIDVYSNLINESYNIGDNLVIMIEDIYNYNKDNTMIKKLEK